MLGRKGNFKNKLIWRENETIPVSISELKCEDDFCHNSGFSYLVDTKCSIFLQKKINFWRLGLISTIKLCPRAPIPGPALQVSPGVPQPQNSNSRRELHRPEQAPTRHQRPWALWVPLAAIGGHWRSLAAVGGGILHRTHWRVGALMTPNFYGPDNIFSHWWPIGGHCTVGAWC